MSNRALGLVREALSAAGMDISYAYEDLIFLEHTGFLLQFTKSERELLLHKNQEAIEGELSAGIALLQQKAGEVGLTIHSGGKYRLIRKNDKENIELQFVTV